MKIHDLKIDKEFAALCPPLKFDELNLLESQIIDEGYNEFDPIIVWANHQDTIIDGHNRYAICRRNKIAFSIKAIALKDRDEVINWMARRQLGRRNLDDAQRLYLQGVRLRTEKKPVGGDGSNQHTEQLSQGDTIAQSTAERLGEEYGVSAATMNRAAKYSEAVDILAEHGGAQAKAAVLNETVKLSHKQAQAIIDAPKGKVEKAAKAAAAGDKDAFASLEPKPPKKEKAPPREAADVSELIERAEAIQEEVGQLISDTAFSAKAHPEKHISLDEAVRQLRLTKSNLTVVIREMKGRV